METNNNIEVTLKLKLIS